MTKPDSYTISTDPNRPPFLVQRFHPNLRIGLVPSVLHGNRLQPIFVPQDLWSSACGAHCAAIALALLGDIHDVSVLSERRNGVAARLWHAARAMYFDGVDVTGLAAMIDDMGTNRPLATCSGSHTRCLDFILAHLAKGEVVIASWHSRRGRQHHWVVIVGTEMRQMERHFKPTALLALDPGVCEPLLCGANSRLEITVHPAPRSKSYVRYGCADGSTLAVTLTSALAIGS